MHHDKVILLRNLWDEAVGEGGAERIRFVKIQHEVSMKQIHGLEGKRKGRYIWKTMRGESSRH